MKIKGNEQCDVICIGVRIPYELHRELKQLADSKDLTLSQLVRLAIKNIIADQSEVSE